MIDPGGPRVGRRARCFLWGIIVVLFGAASSALAQPALPTAAPGAVAPSAAASPRVESSATPAPAAGGGPSPAASGTTPAPGETPTPPPIIVEPPSAGLMPGGSQTLRINGVLGAISFVVANPEIVDVAIDQVARTITLRGKTLGATTVTIKDDRGVTRDIAVRVALPAGSVANAAVIRISGNPATTAFIREQAAQAAIRRAKAQPNATIVAPPEAVIGANAPLRTDNLMQVSVPVIVQGEGYITVQGTTHVLVENAAQPRVRPKSLLVSDYPESLRENGILFTADLSPTDAARFLYFHYNPPDQPSRRLVLKLENSLSQPAVVHVITGQAGPGPNEMEVGHLTTQRFLVRETQNEGALVTVPPATTLTLVDQLMPPGNVVSNLLQLRVLSSASLHLTLLAQSASDPVDGPVTVSALLQGGHPHARGVYSIPEFSFEHMYGTDGPNLEVPIGQIPLPNLRQGEALSGDYGVLQRLTVRIVNNDPASPAQIALYANPRGGRATGTFLIDGVLVQAHALAPFSHFKLRQYTVPPGGHVVTDVVTIPEGGSSYPLRLIFGADDGSVSPGAPGSPIY